MPMLPSPRPGAWGKDARPGEIIRFLSDGTPVRYLGASFRPLSGGKDRRLRKALGYET